MKIVFFGTSEFAMPALRALHAAGHQIIAVVTVPDQPVGRKKILTAPPVKLAALELGLPIYQPVSLKKDEMFFGQFKTLAPDLCVVAAYGKIIPQRYIDIPSSGFLNIHPSLLPKYRGASPVQSAILNGETETGVTIMQIDAEMDHGPIFKSEKVQIKDNETYPELHDRLADIGPDLLVEVINNLGSIKPQEQSHDQATFTKMFAREDGHIDWSRPAEKIVDQIRALNPNPGTWTTWNGKILNIKKAVLSDGRVEIISLQLEGKKETSLAEFLHGHPDFKMSDLK